MCGATFLGIEVDPARARRRVDQAYLDVLAPSLDEALREVQRSLEKGQGRSIGVVGNAAEVLPELVRRGLKPDLVTDQTSAHDPLNGYIPAGVSVDEAAALRARDPAEYQRRSLDAYVAFGDLLGEANVHNNIGRTERRRSRHGEALAAYERALAIRQRIGDELGRIHSHGNIAEIHFLRGELEDAQRHYRTVMELSRAIGYPLGVSNALAGLGATNVALGRVDEAITQLRDAIAELERAGQRTYIVETLRDLTDAYVASRSSLALAAAQRGVDLARELALPELIAIALQALGSARLASGDAGSAATALEESRALLGRGDDRHELGRTLALLARAYAKLPPNDARRTEVESIRAHARGILEELGAALDLRRLAT